MPSVQNESGEILFVRGWRILPDSRIIDPVGDIKSELPAEIAYSAQVKRLVEQELLYVEGYGEPPPAPEPDPGSGPQVVYIEVPVEVEVEVEVEVPVEVAGPTVYVDVPGPTEYVDVPGPTVYTPGPTVNVSVPGPTEYLPAPPAGGELKKGEELVDLGEPGLSRLLGTPQAFTDAILAGIED